MNRLGLQCILFAKIVQHVQQPTGFHLYVFYSHLQFPFITLVKLPSALRIAYGSEQVKALVIMRQNLMDTNSKTSCAESQGQ